MKRIAPCILAALCIGCVRVDSDRNERRSRELYPKLGERDVAHATPAAPLPAFDEDAALETYLRFGLENNPGLKASFMRWRAALEKVPQVTSLPDPQIGWMHFIEEVQTRTGPQENRYTISQGIPWPGKLTGRGRVAALHADGLWWPAAADRVKLVRDIKHAYYEYAWLARAIRITEDNLELLRLIEPVVQRRVQTGASQADLLRLQVEIGKDEDALETLRRFRPALSERLRAAIHFSDPGPLPWPRDVRNEFPALSREELAPRVLADNPELRALDARASEAEARIALARREGYPDFNLGMSWFQTGEAVTAMRPSDSGEDPFEVTFGMTVPIWRRKYAAAVREAEDMHAAALAELDQKTSDLQAALDFQLYQIDDADRRIKLYRDTLIPRARQALDVTLTSYQAASATMTDVIEAQRALLAFEKSYWRASSDHEQRLADLEALAGGELP